MKSFVFPCLNSFSSFFTARLGVQNLRNGKCAVCNHRVMDARGRLLCKKEA